MMSISKRDKQASIEGRGFFISPDNHIHRLKKTENHLSWLKNNIETLKKYDKIITEDNRDIFKRAFEHGWISIRFEFNEEDLSKPFCVITALDLEIIPTIPEKIKDMISFSKYIDFIDMGDGGNLINIPKENIEKSLKRTKYRDNA